MSDNNHAKNNKEIHKIDLTEKLEAFYKKPIAEIHVDCEKELETGKPVGNEIV